MPGRRRRRSHGVMFGAVRRPAGRQRRQGQRRDVERRLVVGVGDEVHPGRRGHARLPPRRRDGVLEDVTPAHEQAQRVAAVDGSVINRCEVRPRRLSSTGISPAVISTPASGPAARACGRPPAGAPSRSPATRERRPAPSRRTARALTRPFATSDVPSTTLPEPGTSVAGWPAATRTRDGARRSRGRGRRRGTSSAGRPPSRPAAAGAGEPPQPGERRPREQRPRARGRHVRPDQRDAPA